MSIIEFRENKTLKLVSVLSGKVPENELFSQDKHIQMLMNRCGPRTMKPLSPLVIYSSGTVGVDTEGTPIVDSHIMMPL
jgi:hypothetical protein